MFAINAETVRDRTVTWLRPELETAEAQTEPTKEQVRLWAYSLRQLGKKFVGYH